mmetsp:Transcript_18057/g.40828  ORF Transcript_18057/g.40828 Transcript_18057/m.40828 type:complete len:111 (-) Transcript_18057:3905-4237(-)
MFGSRSARKLFLENKAAWKTGLAIVTVGTAFKFVYFNFSRGLMVEHMESRHINATEHLRKARQYGADATQQRQDAQVTLSSEERAQLREYLQLMRETQKDVYPAESRRWE